MCASAVRRISTRCHPHSTTSLKGSRKLHPEHFSPLKTFHRHSPNSVEYSPLRVPSFHPQGHGAPEECCSRTMPKNTADYKRRFRAVFQGEECPISRRLPKGQRVDSRPLPFCNDHTGSISSDRSLHAFPPRRTKERGESGVILDSWAAATPLPSRAQLRQVAPLRLFEQVLDGLG